MTAREIWIFLGDLFFGWECQQEPDEALRAEGFFWNRIFSGDGDVSRALAAMDPALSSMPKVDALIWQGTSPDNSDYPGSSPRSVYRSRRAAGLEVFRSQKRFHFLFAESLDPRDVLSGQSLVPRFQELLLKAPDAEMDVLKTVVSRLNEYRLAEKTENDLWISRHHSMASHKRPATLSACRKAPVSDLELLLPHRYYMDHYPGQGFVPNSLVLRWRERPHRLAVGFDLFSLLEQTRRMSSDRDQESLDFALDLFMSQAPRSESDSAEIHAYDHRTGERVVLRVRPSERAIEIL